jgi:hypothetical protein
MLITQNIALFFIQAFYLKRKPRKTLLAIYPHDAFLGKASLAGLSLFLFGSLYHPGPPFDRSMISGCLFLS